MLTLLTYTIPYQSIEQYSSYTAKELQQVLLIHLYMYKNI